MKTLYINIWNRFIFLLVLFSLIISMNITAQQVPVDQKKVIVPTVDEFLEKYQKSLENQQKIMLTKVTEFLEKYELYSQFTIDGVTLEENYVFEFNKLFARDKFNGIYNDLNYEDVKGADRFKLPEEYVSYVRTNYPQGFDQSLDLENLTIVESPDLKGFYRIIVMVRKQLTGLYGGKKIYNFDEYIFFFISAPVTDLENIAEYKITGILSSENYSTYLANRKSKGLYIGLTGAFDRTRIYSLPVYSSGWWSTSMVNYYNAQIELTYMFTNRVGLGTGLCMINYGSSFTINDYNQTSQAQVYDIDGDLYNPVLEISNLTETNSIKCFEVPLLLKTRAGTGIAKFYLDIGIVYSMINESYYTLDGSSVIKGYYPQYRVTLKDLPEYGFGAYDYSSSLTEQMTLTKHLISAHGALGLSLNIGGSFNLKVGARINYGLTDIGFDKVRHSNDFNNILSGDIKSTILQLAGAEIGLSYKIF